MTIAERLARPAVRAQRPYRPGVTVEEARRTHGLERIIKLSSNENPYGTSPAVEAALRDVHSLSVYVDDDYHELRTAIAGKNGLKKDNVIVGHGSNELLELLFETFVDTGDEVVMATPTFSLYPKGVRLRGGVAVEVPLRDGVHDLPAMNAAVTAKTKIVIVCDPNNPTSTIVDPDAFAAFVRALPDDVLLVVDQAYREYMPERSVDGVAWVGERPGTIVYRTFSKAYGLAALRIGYALGDPDTLAWMQRIRLPFNVTRSAVVAALAALRDDAFVAHCVAQNARGLADLETAFARLGLAMYPSGANFVCLRVPVSGDRASAELLERGIAVRSGDALGLPGTLRITVGTPEENAALLAALGDLVPHWNATPVHA